MKKFLSTAAAFFMFGSVASASPMTLNVHEADLRATIMLVARAGNINVSIDDSINGKISATISDTEPQKILEIIAKTKNLNLIQDGNIFIMTTQFNGNAFMDSYLLPIKYGDAANLREAVIKILDVETRLRSDGEGSDYASKRVTTYKERSDGTVEITSQDRSSTNNEKSQNFRNVSETISRENRVVISPDVNALILYGTQAEYERAKKILEMLDVELKQVSLEAKILAIDKNASKNLGIEWFWSAFPQYPQYAYNNDGLIVTTRNEENYNKDTGYGILRFGRSPTGNPYEWYYGAKINALVTNGKAKILSRPNVTTIQGHEAVINVGNRVPVPKVSTNNTSTTTEIQYLDAGIILKYTPRINEDGTITATIHTEVSTPQYVEDLKAYRFNTRSADTVVTVKDGEPMIIGGLIGAEEENSISKIPFLGDLPILGALFRSHKKNKSESELMIFLTAHVIKGAGNGAPANVKYSSDNLTGN